jgi:uncharacterized repeat protein (TIGR01451 family)
MYRADLRAGLATLLTAFAAVTAPSIAANTDGQAPSDAISVRAIAEVGVGTLEQGREVTKLVPADRLVSGDLVMYSLEVRNTGMAVVRAPMVTYPVPQHLSYVADSAVGPGTEISYSVDGGRTFDTADNLKLKDADGQVRTAAAAHYTHIRWQFKNALKGNSVAFVRFRARVN